MVGVVAGMARPRLGAYARPARFTLLPWLGVGALANVSSTFLHDPVAPIALAASLAVLIAVAVANRHITGLAVIALGLGLNLVAVALNEGMPVRPSALVRAHVVKAAELPTTTLRGPRHLESAGDALHRIVEANDAQRLVSQCFRRPIRHPHRTGDDIHLPAGVEESAHHVERPFRVGVAAGRKSVRQNQ